MINYARIEDSIVLEIIDFNPRGRFHPDIIWIECNETVKERYIYDGKDFTAPDEIPAGTEEECLDRMKEIRDEKVKNIILEAYPIYRQLSAIIENASGDSTLLDEIKAFVVQIKSNNPEPTLADAREIMIT